MKTRYVRHFVALLAGAGSLGATAHQSDPTRRAEAALDAWRMNEVGALLPTLPETAAADYVRGVAANRVNDIEGSKRYLLRALPRLEQAHSPLALNTLFALADDYQKSYAYADQARVLRDVLQDHGAELTPGNVPGVKSVLALASALAGSPPQTVTFSGPSQVPIRRNPLGTLDVDAVANGVSGSWMLDSGANYSVVSESFARQLGLSATGAIDGLASSTDATFQSKVAVVDEIRLGSATLRHVAVLVVPDEQLMMKLPTAQHQISAAFGFPVFQGLGRIRFIGDKAIAIGSEADAVDDGTPLFMADLSPAVLLRVEGDMLPFILDTGASATGLTYPYWKRVKARAKDWPHAQHATAGAGGTRSYDTVRQPEWKVAVGGGDVVLKNVRVETVSRAGVGSAPMFGILGQDLWANAAGFTLDFRSMRFRIDKTTAGSTTALR